ncbi:MAG: hemerythrin domain-containing protein [Deltaproteobacteria bacterium]|nr:hemerythrin domain-containing protein [Deltaproteobacteria bacterium]
MNTQELNQIDPLTKQPELGPEQMRDEKELSPMDPPEAYSPPAMNPVSPEEMHPFLRKFSKEHVLFIEELNIFEEALLSIQKTGFTRELDGKLKHFFHFFDSNFVPHSRREEATLFPLLNERLIANGEHSKSAVPMTAIDLMQDEHLQAVQWAAVILNFLGLAFRLPDEKSRLIVLDAALEQGKNLVELLRLHIFREDNIVFPSAHRLISETEFDSMRMFPYGTERNR